MTKPRVCFVFPFPLVGGIETLFASIMKFLPRHIFDVQAIAPTGIEWWLELAVRPYAQVYSYKTHAELVTYINKNKPDICVTCFAFSGIAHAINMASHKPKVIETCHNLFVSVGDSLHSIKEWVHHIVAVSLSVEENVVKHRPTSLSNTPLTIIPSGVDTSVYYPREELNPIVTSFAYFGRISDPEKGIIRLLDGFHALNNKGITLYLYGNAHATKDFTAIQTLVKTRYKTSNIILKGFVQKPQDYMHLHDAVVICSPAEGFCNAALEAMACGIPLVAYNFRGILDHLPTDKRCCLIVKDTKELSKALLDIQSLPLRKELRKNALDYVEKSGSAHSVAIKYHDIFTSLLSTVSVKVAGVCTQLSTSIKHVMENAEAPPILVSYGVKLTPKQVYVAVSALSAYQVVIFNAACPEYTSIIIALRAKGIRCLALYHSSFCGFAFDNLFTKEERANLQLMLDWRKSGYVDIVGFVNKSSAEFYANLGYNTQWVPNIPPTYNDTVDNILCTNGSIHIGIFTATNAMKNTIIAISSALAHPKVIVHITNPITWTIPGIALDNSRIVVHEWLNKEDLRKAMAKMHMTLMLSFTESYGMLVVESWSVGTPCITSSACAPLFDSTTDLYKETMLGRLDDMGNLPAMINRVVANRAKLSVECRTSLENLRKLGQQKFKEFVS